MAPPSGSKPSNIQKRAEKQESQTFEAMQKVFQADAKPFDRRGNSAVCHLCDKKFQSNYNLKRHLKTHSKEDIPCPCCGNQFKTTEYLAKHVKNCTLSKSLENIPKPIAPFDSEISTAITSHVSPPPSSPLSVALQHEVLEKLAQVDKIVQELQQLSYWYSTKYNSKDMSVFVLSSPHSMTGCPVTPKVPVTLVFMALAPPLSCHQDPIFRQ